MKLSLFNQHGNLHDFWWNLRGGRRPPLSDPSDTYAELAQCGGKLSDDSWEIEFKRESDMIFFLLKWT